MYYLLESKKILTDEYCRKYINYEDRENEYVTYVGNDGDMLIKEHFANGCRRILTISIISRVIKKSENIYDLIEKGDLIKLDYSTIPSSEFSVGIRFVDSLTFKGIHYNEDVIIAIYKENKKGDYIKVWEKK